MKSIKLPILFVLLLLFCIISLQNTSAKSYNNSLLHYVSKLRNDIPNRYITPNSSQIDIMKSASLNILNKYYSLAQTQAEAVQYTLTSIKHTNNKTYYILESKSPRHRPWGTYIFYLGSDKKDVAVEVPHPADDKNTSHIGIKLFIDSKAKLFLMSGSKRSKCDVAYNANTIFEGIHEATTKETTQVLQIHSFKNYKYPQIVITTGTSIPPNSLDAYTKQLISYFSVGIYNGSEYSNLGSTDNVQGIYTNRIHGLFAAFFLNRSTATSKTKSNRFISLTEKAISESATTETGT